MKIFLAGMILLAGFIAVVSAQEQTDSVQFNHDAVVGIEPATISDSADFEAMMKVLESGLPGKLRISVRIDAAGRVSSVEAMDGPGDVCPGAASPEVVAVRNAAQSAVYALKFHPATENGRAIESSGTVTLDISSVALDNADSKKETEPIRLAVESYRGRVRTDAQGSESPPRVYTALPGQTPASDPNGAIRPDRVAGGVLNGKVVNAAKPAYPPAARAVRASGTVTVQVLVDETGVIQSAKPVSGHPLLRNASRTAACGTTFLPTTLSGHPVKVSGVITYNFVLPN